MYIQIYKYEIIKKQLQSSFCYIKNNFFVKLFKNFYDFTDQALYF